MNTLRFRSPLALERGITLAEDHGVEASLERWRSERRAIRETILERSCSATIRGKTIDGDGGASPE